VVVLVFAVIALAALVLLVLLDHPAPGGSP
jgi:hypothetical protein